MHLKSGVPKHVHVFVQTPLKWQPVQVLNHGMLNPVHANVMHPNPIAVQEVNNGTKMSVNVDVHDQNLHALENKNTIKYIVPADVHMVHLQRVALDTLNGILLLAHAVVEI